MIGVLESEGNESLYGTHKFVINVYRWMGNEK